MSLSCPSDRTIVITKALWGKYNLPCIGCCVPNPAYDCTVDMATAEPTIYQLLKSQCDGFQTCDVEYVAYIVNKCQLAYTADYQQIFYDCIPFDSSEPIGFAAKLTSSRDLANDAVIPFGTVISNFGGHYSTETYTFNCPVHGVYIFAMTINQYEYSFIRGAIFRNDVELIQSRGDDEGKYDSASATVLVECNVGDQVYVTVARGGTFEGESTACHFMGYLLHQLVVT